MGCLRHPVIENLTEKKPQMPVKLKDRLYPVVLELFSERDFHQVNLRDISAISGISSGTIYKYFSSKEELLFTILEENISRIGIIVKEHISGMEDTKEIFRKVFRVTMDFYDRNPGVAVTAFITVPMRAWMKEQSYRRDQETAFMEQVLAKARERGDIDASVTSRNISDLYYMFCYRHIHSWYYHGMKWNLSDNISRFFDLFWKIMEPRS